ncbi:MAG: DUF3592 domain-containing protein [Chloroflexota bacterium]
MQSPLFLTSELRHIARVLGAMLMVSGGLALLLQGYVGNIFPPTAGFVESEAIVVSRERTGTFREPGFLLTLLYTASDENGMTEEIRSGHRVEFEQYFDLAEGDSVEIHYNPADPYEWRLVAQDSISEYGLGLLMVILGCLSLAFPALISWASRQDDFESDIPETTHPTTRNTTSGATIYSYDNTHKTT